MREPAAIFHKWDDERGFVLTEIAFGLAIISIVFIFIFRETIEQAEQLKVIHAAERLAEVHRAATRFISENPATIDSLTASGPATINTATLVAGNFLPTSFNDGNAFGQFHSTFIRQLQPGVFEFVTVGRGGTPIADFDLRHGVTILGAAGGLIESLNPGTIQGVFNGWSIPVGNFGALSSELMPGHLAALGGFSNGQLLSDFLNKSVVPGFPEANRMNTALDLGGNNIVGVNDIFFESLGIWASQGLLASTQIVVNGSTISKPICPNGAPTIWVPSSTVSDGNGNSVSGFHFSALDLGTEWEISIEVASQAGVIQPAGSAAQGVAFVKCT